MTTEGPRLRVNLLGEPDISWDGETLRIPSRKGLALVCYLAHTGAPLSRSELADMLWPNSAARLTNLRWELHNLRSLSGAASWLSTPGRKVAVRAETDLERMDELLAEGRFAAALEMASAPFLNDLSLDDAPAFVEWLEDERALVADRHMRALAGEATRLESGSRLSEARELADRLLMLDPLDEAKHRTVMRLALKQGDLSVAAAQFEHCRRVLAQELGLQPTPETLELAAAIEQAATVRGPAVTRKRLPPELLRPPQLVGRQSEWERLGAAWDQQQIIFISGRPGIGKTRLAQDFIRSRVGEDVAVLRGHMGDQFLPFSGYSRGWRGVFSRRPELAEELPEWVRDEVALFLPDIFKTTGAPRIETRFAKALVVLYRQLLASFGAALVDDIQYFDEASWRLGGLALQELSTEAHQRLGRMVITFRTDEMPPEFMVGLAGLVAGRYAVHIELGPLQEDGLADLLTSLQLDASKAGRLSQLTGGNPYFVLEVLRQLHSEPDLDLNRPASQLLADTVHHIIRARLERLPGNALSVARALAVLGEMTTPRLLASVTGLSESEAESMLDVLESFQMVRRMRLTHDLLQEAILTSLPGAERRRLHARITELHEAGTVPAEALKGHRLLAR